MHLYVLGLALGRSANDEGTSGKSSTHIHLHSSVRHTLIGNPTMYFNMFVRVKHGWFALKAWCLLGDAGRPVAEAAVQMVKRTGANILSVKASPERVALFFPP